MFLYLKKSFLSFLISMFVKKVSLIKLKMSGFVVLTLTV
ncbi:hypothetical protein HPHPP1_0062 [Helicobacter pylori Hp P-1]|nr:hypothetical protein HPHPP1_0062 [Helicobacter pylori Hp P-1]EJC22499.1 hypothetical protein HPHPP1B_0058 [Helicobacter pylori Hp P-1b]